MIQLWKKFRGDDKPPPHLGSSKDYNIDMNPKVIHLFSAFLVFNYFGASFSYALTKIDFT